MDPNYVGGHICSAFLCSTYQKKNSGYSKFRFLNKIQIFKIYHPKIFCVMHSTSKSRTYMTTNIVRVHLNSITDLMKLKWTQQKISELRISVSRCELQVKKNFWKNNGLIILFVTFLFRFSLKNWWIGQILITNTTTRTNDKHFDSIS